MLVHRDACAGCVQNYEVQNQMKRFLKEWLKYFALITACIAAVAIITGGIILGIVWLCQEHYVWGSVTFWLLLAGGGAISLALGDE